MTRYPLLPLALLALTVACAEAPSEPPTVTRPSLDRPPPPPPDGIGVADFSLVSVGFAAASAQSCTPPPSINFEFRGKYFVNPPQTMGWFSIKPTLPLPPFTDVSGEGKITERGPLDAPIWTANGNIVLQTVDQTFHLRFEDPAVVNPPLRPSRPDGVVGAIVPATLSLCGEQFQYEGVVLFGWAQPGGEGPGIPNRCDVLGDFLDCDE